MGIPKLNKYEIITRLPYSGQGYQIINLIIYQGHLFRLAGAGNDKDVEGDGPIDDGEEERERGGKRPASWLLCSGGSSGGYEAMLSPVKRSEGSGGFLLEKEVVAERGNEGKRQRGMPEQNCLREGEKKDDHVAGRLERFRSEARLDGFMTEWKKMEGCGGVVMVAGV
ncbi:hypothetical protein HAX54_019340 [Datura stramonium]|uniref:Uncharacterized protein n=1 Tax=Datura stramonium TaxID=4076 RepID=A0ABS8UP26_DATST|nr:hypothetical protein [Datura stramonium]